MNVSRPSMSSVTTPVPTSRSKPSTLGHLTSGRAAPEPTFRTGPRGPTSASSSSDSGSNGSDSTITSDGGFTDYLSDESEQELQRQAEARAALIAQSQAEELEFKAARQRLVGIDLRPDEHWKGTNITHAALNVPLGNERA